MSSRLDEVSRIEICSAAKENLPSPRREISTLLRKQKRS